MLQGSLDTILSNWNSTSQNTAATESANTNACTHSFIHSDNIWVLPKYQAYPKLSGFGGKQNKQVSIVIPLYSRKKVIKARNKYHNLKYKSVPGKGEKKPADVRGLRKAIFKGLNLSKDPHEVRKWAMHQMQKSIPGRRVNVQALRQTWLFDQQKLVRSEDGEQSREAEPMTVGRWARAPPHDHTGLWSWGRLQILSNSHGFWQPRYNLIWLTSLKAHAGWWGTKWKLRDQLSSSPGQEGR